MVFLRKFQIKWLSFLLKRLLSYGGNLPDTTNKDERVLIQKTDEHITTITFILNQSNKIKVYENYGAYICGFSYDGNYFVIANDGGIIVIKRGTWSEHG